MTNKYEKITVKEISRMLNVSRSTASKIKADIMENIKNRSFLVRADLENFINA